MSQIPGVVLRPDPPPTNIIVIDLAGTGKSVAEVDAGLRDRGIWMVPFGATYLRAVAHLDVTEAEMLTAAEALAEVVGG